MGLGLKSNENSNSPETYIKPCFAGFELLADFIISLVIVFYNRCDVYDLHVHVQFYCYIIHVCGLAPELMSMFIAM